MNALAFGIMPHDPNAPIARWLRSARQSQGWSQDELLRRLSDYGWPLQRTNYSRYENGRQTPKPENLVRLNDFWTRLGQPYEDVPPAEPPENPYLVAMLRNADAAERQAVALERLVEAFSGPQTTPEEIEALRAWVRSQQAGASSPRARRRSGQS